MDSRIALNRIISDGFCIGCGACAVASSDITVRMQADGQYRAQWPATGRSESGTTINDALFSCPFSDTGPNEDELGELLYGRRCQHDQRIGWYHDLYAGHIAEGAFRECGASGGVITWLLTQLLDKGLADAVIHIHKANPAETGVLFRYGISRTAEDIAVSAKSRYYPVEFSKVMAEVRSSPGRYIFVGLPCFVKAVRRLCRVDPVLQERIVYCIGLVCGHLKSKAFADCFGWQAGILPGKLEEIDFRVKIPGRSANDYGVLLRSMEIDVVKPTRELFGANWGANFFRHSACDYCDDVFAETADVAVGDAWLPEYMDESKGNSIVVVRCPELTKLFYEARADGRARLDVISPDLMAQSQASGLRDRCEGLAYRLYLKERNGKWAPSKRVKPSRKLSRTRKKIYNYRLKLRRLSHTAWQQAVASRDFEIFRHRMQPYVNRLDNCYRSFSVRTLLGRIKRAAFRFAET